MSLHIERREFLKQAILAGTATASLGSFGQLRSALAAEKSPNEKLNLAFIGVAKGRITLIN